MRIHLLSIGRRMPPWVEQGFGEYAKRLPPECALQLVAIGAGPSGKGRGKAAASAALRERLRDEECARLLRACPSGALLVALDVAGKTWSTEQLADRLRGWLAEGRDIALLVGGPDGLSADCLARADVRWSLSPLTFPHPLVRVMLAEQIYRAWSILAGHPYHRGDR